MEDLLDNDFSRKRKYRMKVWVLAIWFAVFCIGYLFRMMHWPFASYLRILGGSGIMGYSLAACLLFRGRDITNNALSLISVLYLVLLIWGAFFNGGYPFNVEGLAIQLVVLLIFFAGYIVLLRSKKQNYSFGNESA
jgi:hypothetical protein